ncbi:MAG: PLP-dependent aminotransferase family protein [Verrucomicrobiales bacterium]|nr:PLP-dependent aminotransferase family protein [Verrucomicrobiales bacterium]
MKYWKESPRMPDAAERRLGPNPRSEANTIMDWNRRFAGRTRHMQRSTVRELLKVAARPEIISFAGGLPAAEFLPVDAVRRATESVLARRAGRALQYGESEGIPELREWIARRESSASLTLRPENILITHGAQQALDLIGRVLLDGGDTVLVENPTYLALLSAWRPWEVRFVPLPGDHDGLRTDSLHGLDRGRTRAKLLYTIPNFQNPSGTTLSHPRRQELVQECRTRGIGVVEDDPYGELRYEGEAPPSLLSLDAALAAKNPEASNVLRVGTFSKTLAPGLRLGWVTGPTAVIDKLVQARQATDLHPATLNQWIALELLEQGSLEERLPAIRAEYRRRRDLMIAALDQHLGRFATWTRPQGGMFLLVQLNAGKSAADLLPEALKAGIAFVPGDVFHTDASGANTLRLNFSNTAPERIEEGIRRLAGVVATAFAA